MTDSIRALHELGQSLWYDNIQRRLLENGELAGLIARGEIRGVTSNPSIFNNAIAHTSDYETALATLAWSGLDGAAIFYRLAVEDIRAAADLFRPLYESTQGGDGYVSLEVDPNLAYDAETTISEARRLWQLVDRPNLMVKIPATAQGLPAIRDCIAEGINVNVTLIFSLQRYGQVIDAYLAGLERRREAGLPLERVASVASFFVSRVDTKVDRLLREILRQEGSQASLAAGLLGKAAVANANLAYARFRETFGGKAFAALKAAGARPQRPLWASTSTKDPAYPDVKYVEELIAPDTINTIPPGTLDAFRDHGRARLAMEDDFSEAIFVLNSLALLGISMDQVTQQLEAEGVKAFADAFNSLLATIEERRLAAVRQLGGLGEGVADRIREMGERKVPQRLHARDASLWSQNHAIQEHIRQRLGWLRLPESSRALLPELQLFAGEARRAGFERCLLLGMGGSSLAAEVMSRSLAPSPAEGGEAGGLTLRVLDSTDPVQVLEAERWAAQGKTLYAVSSKSGETVEVNAFAGYFWAREGERRGEGAGERFIAITDPGTGLEQLARRRKFRRAFLADPTVGGRNSALSAFGLVPAALMGIDLERLLDRAAWMAAQCAAEVQASRNPGLALGAALGEAALQRRDKLTLLADPGLAPFCAWLEQLIAESTGKQGKGIIPLVGEPLADAERYGPDRLFVYLRREGWHDEAMERLREAGHPALAFTLEDAYDLGAEFYRWEVATAIASALLEVNSFDQPDVQDSKARTRAMIEARRQGGKLPEGEPVWEGEGVALYGPVYAGLEGAGSLREALEAFLGLGKPGEYVALNAYLKPGEENEAMLAHLRVAIFRRTSLATAAGFGPRYLHSTGQLHKGGPNTGLFLLLTADPDRDVDIPGHGLTFGELQRAQALGDLEALLGRGRRVLRLHLADADGLGRVVEALAGD